MAIATGAPRANGQIDITPMLSKFSSANNKWDLELNKVEFALNNTFNKSIKNAPSKILFGIYQRGKVDDELRLYLESINAEERNLGNLKRPKILLRKVRKRIS